MKKIFNLSLILLLFSVIGLAEQNICGAGCNLSNNTCVNNACRGCTTDGVSDVCQDCCFLGITDPTVCGSIGCEWDPSSSQCRNRDNIACIPEVPNQSRSWLIIGFGLLAVVLSGGAVGYRKIRNRPS